MNRQFSDVVARSFVWRRMLSPAFVKFCCRQGATVRLLVGLIPAGYEQIGSVAATISLLHLVSGRWTKKGPRMTRLRWSRFVAVAIVSWHWGAGRLAAQVPERAPSESIADLRREVRDLRLKLLENESQAEELTEEEKLLAAPAPPGGETDGRPLSAKDDLWKQTVMGAAFSDNTQAGSPPVIEKLRSARELAGAKEKEAVDAWGAATEKRMAFWDEVAQAEAVVGRAWPTEDPEPAFPLGLLALGTLAVLGGLVLAIHEARDRLRWRLRGRSAAGPAAAWLR